MQLYGNPRAPRPAARCTRAREPATASLGWKTSLTTTLMTSEAPPAACGYVQVWRFTRSSQNGLLATGGGCRLLAAQASGLSTLYSTRASRSQSSFCSWQHGTTDYLWIALSPTLHASATGRSVLTRGQR